MDHSCFIKSGNCLAGQEIPRALWNLNIHYHIHGSLPPVPVEPTNTVHTIQYCFFMSLLT